MPLSTGVGLAPPPSPNVVPPPSQQKKVQTNHGRERGSGAREGNNDDDEDDDDNVTAISQISISVDRGRAGGDNRSESRGGTSQSSVKPNKITNGKAPTSSLRSLLGVPSPGASRLTPAVQAKASTMSAGQLAVPPSTSAATAPLGVGGAPSARVASDGKPTPSIGPKTNVDGQQVIASEIAPKRKKVVLGPGCSALDWARLKGDLTVKRQQQMAMTGVAMRKITRSELNMHKSRDDAWSVFQGKVYDITPYLCFHPGGIDELMRVAGRDGTRLFMLTHSWVNLDAMIDACCIGILVPDS